MSDMTVSKWPGLAFHHEMHDPKFQKQPDKVKQHQFPFQIMCHKLNSTVATESFSKQSFMSIPVSTENSATNVKQYQALLYVGPAER